MQQQWRKYFTAFHSMFTNLYVFVCHLWKCERQKNIPAEKTKTPGSTNERKEKKIYRHLTFYCVMCTKWYSFHCAWTSNRTMLRSDVWLFVLQCKRYLNGNCQTSEQTREKHKLYVEANKIHTVHNKFEWGNRECTRLDLYWMNEDYVLKRDACIIQFAVNLSCVYCIERMRLCAKPKQNEHPKNFALYIIVKIWLEMIPIAIIQPFSTSITRQ